MRKVNFAATFLIPFCIISVGIAQDRPRTKTTQPEIGIAKHGSFNVLYSAKGEAQSAEKIEIRCKTSGVILRMVPEGTKVKPGDFLLSLSNTKQQNAIDTERIALVQAEAELISAQAREQSANEAIIEYERRIYVQQKNALQREIYVAEKVLKLSQEEYKAAENAGNTTLELKLAESEYELDVLKKRLAVLQDITSVKRSVELKSAKKVAAVALISARKIFEIHRKRLEDAQKHFSACTIIAPEGVNGEVYFSYSRTAEGLVTLIDIGSQVHEGQIIAYIPIPPKMNVIVHLPQTEAFRVSLKMRARIRILDRTYNGYVKSLTAKRSRPSPFGDVRGLTGICIVRVIDPPYFKPGMSVDVTIKLAEVRDKIYLPVNSIHKHRGENYCCIQNLDSTYETRKLVTGPDNGRFVEIKSGISDGDRYLLNPGDWPKHLTLPSVIEPSLDEEFDFPVPIVNPPNGKKRRPARTDVREGQRRGRGGEQGGGGGAGGSGFSTSSIVDRMMSQCDTNRDGTIDKNEQAGLNERVREIVRNADSNGDGAVTKEEMETALAAMMKRFPGGGSQTKKTDK